jgi:PAS domain S-box-containing protein
MITDRQCRAGHAKPQREAGLTREPERPMAERTRALSTGETQLHRILDRIADMVVTIDDEGRIESFNQAAETAFGYCAAEIVGREASMLLAERDRGRHDKQLRRRGAADADGMRSSPTDGVEALRRNGSAFPIELDIDEMELNGRRLFVAILRDVSERRRIEDEMRRSAQQLSLIANALPVLIAYLDADLCYRYVNKTFADWWQIPVHQAVGRSIAEALGLEAFEAIRPYFEAVLRGETLTFDREILHPDGRKRLCHAYYAPHFDEARRILGIVTLVEDVTERRRSEQALSESQHSLANAQRIAHIGNWDWDVATGSPAIEPAPTTSTRLPATSPTCAVARSSATVTSEGAALSMSVSACTRLPTRSACWNSVFRAGPIVPDSWPTRSASRACPRIWPSPTTIESSPAATWNRWETAPSS